MVHYIRLRLRKPDQSNNPYNQYNRIQPNLTTFPIGQPPPPLPHQDSTHYKTQLQTKSPPKHPLLHRPKHHEADGAKRKRQLEPDIPPILRVADRLADGADEPDLRHAHDGAEDAEAEGQDGGDAGREEARVVPDGDVVLAALEDEVLAQGDAFVDGEPVALLHVC